jgi:hypothetical protein
MPRFRPKKEPKASYFEQETKNEMINRWEKMILKMQELKEQKLREGDKAGAERCQRIAQEAQESIFRERERMGLKTSKTR